MKLEKFFFLVTSVFPFVFSFQVAMSSIDNDDILSIGSQESCSLIEDVRETLKKKRERETNGDGLTSLKPFGKKTPGSKMRSWRKKIS